MNIYSSDSEWDSSSDSGIEDHEDADFLYGGQAQSILSSLEQSIEKIDDLLSFERGFVLGDMVYAADAPSGQMGRVVGIDMLVDLESVRGKTIKSVNSKNLSKILSFSAGDTVVCGPWVGRVENVVVCVTVVFDDGTKIEVNNPVEQDKLLPVSPNVLEDAQYPFYPGQRVKVKLSTASKSAKWLCGNWRENQDEGTVCSVDAGLIYVDWIASVLGVGDPGLPSPPRLVDSKKVKVFSCFSHANWQLGDCCKIHLPGQKPFSGSKFEEIFEIVKTKTHADVLWQDGSVSRGLDSQTLLPATVVNSYEFWPGQFVMEKGSCDDQYTPGGQKWGVVLGMDAKERTVKVQWETLTSAGLGEKTIETLSSYELMEHPDFAFGFGDLVFRLVQKNNQADLDHLSRGSEGKRFHGSEKNGFPDEFWLSCIGSVVGFKNGAVEVKWASGITSTVEPAEIYRVDKIDRSAAVSEDENAVELNEPVIELQTSRDKKDLMNSVNIGNNCKTHIWESTSFFLPQAAIGFFTNIATSLLGSSGSTPLSDETKYRVSSTNEDEVTSDVIAETQVIDEVVDISGEKMLDPEVKQTPRDNENENQEKFRRFDMVKDCPDHQFITASQGLSSSQVKRSWLRKVQQEWSILEKNLPDTIYVRVFEENLSLIRAAIVGAHGTPYHDGVFFFDIYLPPEYPQEPPMVHYNSGGLRLNPNLYESGKVCLSLLNTWAGSDTEVWNPENSTILQVLLSLQALVLNEKPYFNEAGFDQQVGKAEGEKNSVSYNESVYLSTCKSMLYILRKPPKHFEDLVEEHFRRRSQNILTACKAYIDRAPIACDKTGQDYPIGSSTGFKIMLSKLFPKLVEEFSKNGIDCSQVTTP